jgi:hypothetical protein
MAASRYDLVVEQGVTWALTVTVRKKNGLPLSLFGYVGKSQIKKSHSEEDLIDEFSVEITDPEKGILVMRLSEEQTSVMDFTVGVYDVILISPDRVTARILEGSVKFSPRVTKESTSGYSGYSGYSE